MLENGDERAFEIFEKALLIEDEHERNCFIERSCDGNPHLRNRVYNLLQLSKTTDDHLIRSILSPKQQFTGDLTELSRGLNDELRDHGLSLTYYIGAGGSSHVFQCQTLDPGFSDYLAIKVLKSEFKDSSIRDRFLRETETLRDLNHPGIVKFVRKGELSDGRPFCVMEYIKGYPLLEFTVFRRLEFTDRLRFLIRISEAVRYAHSRGVIHRDLKPGNILVVRQDGVYYPKIIDFGIARRVESRNSKDEKYPLTKPFHLFGTPGYMSPEQAEGRHDLIDVSTDIFCCGVIFYELLTGSHPFPDIQSSMVPVQNYKQHISSNPPPPINGVPGSLPGRIVESLIPGKNSAKRKQNNMILSRILTKCCRAEPSDRYATMNELEEDLLSLEADRIPPNIELTPTFLWSSFIRRHSKAAVVTVAFFFFILYSVAQHLVNVRTLAEKNREISLSQSQLSEHLYFEEIYSAYNSFNNSVYASSLRNLNTIKINSQGTRTNTWEYRYLNTLVNQLNHDTLRPRRAKLQITGHLHGDKYRFTDWSNKAGLIVDISTGKIEREKHTERYYMGVNNPGKPEEILCALWARNDRDNLLRLERFSDIHSSEDSQIVWQNYTDGWVRIGGFGPGESEVFIIDETSEELDTGEIFYNSLIILDRESGEEKKRTRILENFQNMRINWHQVDSPYSRNRDLLAILMHDSSNREALVILLSCSNAEIYDTIALGRYELREGYTQLPIPYGFSPDGTHLAILNDNLLSIYSVETKSVAHRIEFQNQSVPIGLSWFDNSTIFCAYDRTVMRITMENEAVRQEEFIAAFGKTITGLLADPSNSLVLTSHSDGSITRQDAKKDLRRNPNHAVIQLTPGSSRYILDWHLEEDSLSLSYVDATGLLRSYRFSDGEYDMIDSQTLVDGMKSAAFSPDGRKLAFTTLDHKLKVLDRVTGDAREIDSPVYKDPAPLFMVDNSNDLNLLYTSGPSSDPTRKLTILNIQSGKRSSISIKNGRFQQCHLASLNEVIIENNTGTAWDALPYVYFSVNLHSGETKPFAPVNLSNDVYTSFSVSMEKGLIAGGPAFNGIMDLNSRDFRRLEDIEDYETDRAIAYKFFPQSDRVAVVSNRNLKTRVTIHEVDKGEIAAEIPLNTGMVNYARLQVTPDLEIISCLLQERGQFHLLSPEPLVR